MDTLIDELNLYREYLEKQKFTCPYAANGTFLFEGNGLSVVFIIIIKDDLLYTDITPV